MLSGCPIPPSWQELVLYSVWIEVCKVYMSPSRAGSKELQGRPQEQDKSYPQGHAAVSGADPTAEDERAVIACYIEET